MSDINIVMDISSVVSETAKLLNLNKKQRDSLKDLIATTINLNDAGKASSAYVDQQVSASRRLITVIRNIGQENESASKKIVATSQAIQRQRDAFQALLSETNRAKVGSIASGIKADFTTTELARIEKIKTAIGKLDTEVIKPKNIKEFFDSIKKGEIPEATGALAKLREELVKLNNIREAAKARSIRTDAGSTVNREEELRRRALGRSSAFQQRFEGSFVSPIASALGIDPNGLSLKDEASIRKVGSNIARILRNNVAERGRDVIDSDKLQGIFPDLLKGKKLDFINKPELQAASDQLSKLIGLFERLKKSQDSVASAATAKAANSAKATASNAAASQRADDFRNTFETNFTKELERQFKIKTSGLTRRQEGVLRNASANLAKTIAGSDSGLDTTKIQDVFSKIRAGGVVTGPEGSELSKVASELTKVIGLYERLRQEKDRQSRINQNSLDQRLKSSVEAERDEKRVGIIQTRLQRGLDPLRSRLNGIDPSLDPDSQGKLSSLLRKIAELGQKSNLSSREVQGLYDRLNSGALTNADAKYARLVDRFQKLNDLLNRSRGQANNFVASTGGTEPPFPGAPKVAGGGALPPKPDDIGRAKEYSGIFQKIRDGLEYFLVYKGFNFLTNQLQTAFDNARKFQVQISLIRTISQDGQVSFGELQRNLIAVSNTSGIALDDVANASYDAVSNQVVRARQLKQFQGDAANLARTTNSSLQDSVNLLSGAINSYGLDAADAEQISAKFFKAIDIGKIKASELANTFGRVAFVGRDLGVSFDEILGILSTLTQKGVTTDDAVTLLTNGFSKLTNPTEKTKNLLKEIGFESGQRAVQVLGFAKTMKILTEAVSSGRLELTDLFNEIRGEKFASAFKTFNEDILKNTKSIGQDSLGTYRQAIDIRGESDADKINKQINELKNSLTTTFGSELTKLLSSLIDTSGGVSKLTENITILTKIVLIGGQAFLTYKAVMLATSVISAAYNGVVAVSTGLTTALTRSRALLTGTTAANTIATGANTAAMATNRLAYVAHPIGLLLAAGGALYAYYQTQNVQIGEQNEKIQALNDAYKKFLETQKKVAATNAFSDYNKTVEAAEEQIKNVGQKIAAALGAANAELDVAKNRATTTASNLKEGFEKYVNFMKDRISDVSREYNKFDDRIKNSAKSILDFRELARKQLFDTQLKYSGGFDFDQFGQREKLLSKELGRLKDEINQLFNVGSDAKLGPTDEDLQKARELGKTYLQILGQRNDLREDRSQQSLERDVKRNPNSYRPDESGKVYRGVDTSRFEKEQDAFVDFITALEKQQQKRATVTKDKDEQSILQKKEALLKAENAIKELDNIQIFDKGGNVRAEFKNPVNDRVDIGKVREAFLKGARKAKGALDPESLKKLGPEIERLLGERIQSLEAEISASQAVEALNKKQNGAIEGGKRLNQSFKDGRAEIQKYAQDIQSVTTSLDGLVEGLGKFTGSKALEKVIQQGIDAKNGYGTDTRFRRGINRLPSAEDAARALGLVDTPSSSDQAKAKLKPLQDEASSIQDALKALKTKTEFKDGIQTFDPKEVQGILTRVDALREKVKEELKKNLGSDQVALPEIQASIPELDKLSAQLNESLRASSAGYNQSILNLNQLKQNSADLTKELVETLGSLQKFGEAATVGAAGTAKPFEDISGRVQSLNLKLDATLQKFSELQLKREIIDKLPGPELGPPKASPKDLFEPPKALGGMMNYYAAGGAVGSDNQAVYAQAGEYIWNRTATRQFYSQIQAMNGRGRTPIEFHTTTGDTVNVGGVTINESKSGQSTASDVLRTIKRQQRRG